jgi:hypothetical protein
MRLRWCFAIGALIAVSGANAQIVPDIATDQELFAAYCTGAIYREKGPAETVRFRDYLASRGLFADPRRRSLMAIQGINVAAERGAADQNTCKNAHNACLSTCLSRENREMSEVANCAAECTNSDPQCGRVSRCRKSSAGFPY